ncbi:DoxX family protein [Candidatus Nomurabacteria bacterium RIFCSPHIGHO2_02_FULL_35_13]|uniref:DoxX family protein n=1 Tax=Candidatus Nomurabacteria bacterium RIFCSPHIGHO2_02_FULL_35_13 TaxID=1801748 RepID=A0A1F6VPT8_9BACT|nr:MAG: DoxX family protein [Candidatus Nomurabacteria bacterium RIFCSPHIGHO2_02_FULL_35_13]
MEYLFVLGRILLGGYFIMSGFNHFKSLDMLAGYAQSKGVPMHKTSVILTGAMMFLGGLGILLGIYIQISVLLIAVFLFVAAFKMHQYWKVSDPMYKMGEQVNFYKNLGLLGAVLMLLAIPLPWTLSLF